MKEFLLQKVRKVNVPFSFRIGKRKMSVGQRVSRRFRIDTEFMKLSIELMTLYK